MPTTTPRPIAEGRGQRESSGFERPASLAPDETVMSAEDEHPNGLNDQDPPAITSDDDGNAHPDDDFEIIAVVRKPQKAAAKAPAKLRKLTRSTPVETPTAPKRASKRVAKAPLIKITGEPLPDKSQRRESQTFRVTSQVQDDGELNLDFSNVKVLVSVTVAFEPNSFVSKSEELTFCDVNASSLTQQDKITLRAWWDHLITGGKNPEIFTFWWLVVKA